VVVGGLGRLVDAWSKVKGVGRRRREGKCIKKLALSDNYLGKSFVDIELVALRTPNWQKEARLFMYHKRQGYAPILVPISPPKQ